MGWRSVIRVLSFLVLVLIPSNAYATAPMDLEPGQVVVDEAGVLSTAEQQQVEDAIGQLQSEEGLLLTVVYVDEFSNPANSDAWAAEFTQRNNLGNTDALLLIATVGEYAFYAYDDEHGPQEQQIAQNYIVPQLAEVRNTDDWAAPALGAVEGLGGGSSGMNVEFSPVVMRVLIVVVIGGGLVIFWLVRRNRRSQPQVAQRMSIGELKRRAGSSLVAADDALHQITEEIAFAQAAYGVGSTDPFETQLTTARESLQEAFATNSALADEDDESQREELIKILSTTESVLDLKAEVDEYFDGLRDIETQAEDILAQLKQRWAELSPRISAAKQASERLLGSYRGLSVEEVEDNMAHIVQGRQQVDTELAAAEERLAAQQRSQVALHIRAAEDAVANIEELLTGIEHKEVALKHMVDNLKSGVAQSEADIAEARTHLDAGGRPQLAQPARHLEDVVAQVKVALNQPVTDPETLLNELSQAHEQLSVVLDEVRNAQERERKARATLGSLIPNAQAKIEGTSDFIASRRGTVGPAARSVLAESEKHLGRALESQDQDPVGALNAARQSALLADRASQLARNDAAHQGFNDFSYASPTRTPGISGANLARGLFWGAMASRMLGSGRNTGGFGGSGRSGGGFGGGFGGGRGGFGGSSGGARGRF